MRLEFLGSGSAFTLDDNFNSNLLVTASSGRRLLIDAGVDLRHSLRAMGLGYLDVDDVYISHLHSDHIGGLEYLGLSGRFDPRCERPRLFIVEQLLAPLWQSLRGGMGCVAEGESTIRDYFEPVPCESGFTWEGIEFEIVPLPHVRGDTDVVMYSYGLRLSVGDDVVFITTDTRFELEYLQPHYDAATIVFQDCETAVYHSPVHAHFEELCGLPEAIRAKLWLYHFQPGERPDAHAAGFRGFVTRGQSFEFDEAGGPVQVQIARSASMS